jgi:hypothetical protein
VGVAIKDTKASIKEYKQQKHYNEWEFVYDPIEDQLQGGGALFGGATQNLNGTGTTGTGTPNGAGGLTGGTGIGGNTSPTGTNPSGGTGTSPTPQQ